MSNRLCYTGVGSRQTPAEVLRTMQAIGRRLAVLGWTLRSGAAEGADTAFEQGCDEQGGDKEIYLPWQGFNGHTSALCEPTRAAMQLASEIHPAWATLSQGAQKLHARNCHQVMGSSLQAFSELLVCWTPEGRVQGGTATAIKLAQRCGLPIFNLAVRDVRDLGPFVHEAGLR